ncbi:unnamed protein product [Staurois parvus]|uniref:Uncharacterized protein n=1 Tax=Staurois parvus TaxID=386267 RepID=A0ABN9DQM3_9NEOB|nr:unnamed protein product [Staurois parvus]
MTSSHSHCACAAQEARSGRSAVRCVPRTQRITNHGKSRRCQLGHVISCKCHLSVSISALCQCSSVPRASAHQCHISVPTSAHQCHISVPI